MHTHSFKLTLFEVVSMATENDNDMPSDYRASLSTGIFGHYTLPKPVAFFNKSDYKASLSTGVYGSYTIQNQSFNAQKMYTYFPSISNGIFGTWIYNASSPYIINPIESTKRVNKKSKASSRYGLRNKSKASQREEYQFEIQGPRNEEIKNGKKYNVKLLQEYKLTIGKGLAKFLKEQKNGDEELRKIEIILI